MTEQDHLDRLERKIDAIASDVFDLKLAFAEFKGARKMLYGIAMVVGTIAGVLAAYFTRRNS